MSTEHASDNTTRKNEPLVIPPPPAEVRERIKSQHAKGEYAYLTPKPEKLGEAALPFNLIFRRPTAAEYAKFRRYLASPADSLERAKAPEILLRDTILYPTDPALVDRLFEEYPAIKEPLVNEVAGLAGLVEVEKKEL